MGERKSWSTENYSEILPYLNGPKKTIATVELTRSHTTIVYWIPPDGRNEVRECDDCKEQAEYLYFDQDHTMRYYLRLFCKDHASYPLSRWLNEER